MDDIEPVLKTILQNHNGIGDAYSMVLSHGYTLADAERFVNMIMMYNTTTKLTPSLIATEGQMPSAVLRNYIWSIARACVGTKKPLYQQIGRCWDDAITAYIQKYPLRSTEVLPLAQCILFKEPLIGADVPLSDRERAWREHPMTQHLTTSGNSKLQAEVRDKFDQTQRGIIVPSLSTTAGTKRNILNIML